MISRLSMVPFITQKRELIAVMIENHESARPHQRGIKEALMIQEYMVEGMISRFVVIFDRNDLPEVFGPVRSLRPYFLDAVLPSAKVILHAGGSPEAIERVKNGDSITAINALYYDGDEFVRMEDVPAPHNLFTGKEYLRRILPEDISAGDWPPYEIGTQKGGSGAITVKINFLNPLHNVAYSYKSAAKEYERDNGGIISPARPENVVILEIPINGEGEYGRLDIDMYSGGRMLLFRNGKVFHGTWRKNSEKEFFSFFGLDGKPLKFSSGQAWITGLPDLSRVKWQ